MLLGDNMFWWLWNYLRGYVIIKVTGFSAERFINLAVLRGIAVWDIKNVSSARIMKVGMKNFHLCEECARRCGCRIEIIKTCGASVMIKKLLKKKVFSAGIAVFAVLPALHIQRFHICRFNQPLAINIVRDPLLVDSCDPELVYNKGHCIVWGGGNVF